MEMNNKDFWAYASKNIMNLDNTIKVSYESYKKILAKLTDRFHVIEIEDENCLLSGHWKITLLNGWDFEELLQPYDEEFDYNKNYLVAAHPINNLHPSQNIYNLNVDVFSILNEAPRTNSRPWEEDFNWFQFASSLVNYPESF